MQHLHIPTTDHICLNTRRCVLMRPLARGNEGDDNFFASRFGLTITQISSKCSCLSFSLLLEFKHQTYLILFLSDCPRV